MPELQQSIITVGSLPTWLLYISDFLPTHSTSLNAIAKIIFLTTFLASSILYSTKHKIFVLNFKALHNLTPPFYFILFPLPFWTPSPSYICGFVLSVTLSSYTQNSLSVESQAPSLPKDTFKDVPGRLLRGKQMRCRYTELWGLIDFYDLLSSG